jgi:predicted enzyme related to lactoylglutathione lyase
MKIEHIGILVSAPVTIGNWYNKHFNFEIIRQLGTDEDGVTFLKDNETNTVLEFAKLKEVLVFDLNELNPLQIHIAIECDDPIKLSQKLSKYGAKIIGESTRAEGKNERILIKDPWGVTIQLINRKNKL